ncbi:hypothetical protein DPEC_G00056200 [Dallia pectoralis]|uniref:Uncharacterized protein n=1 Tax=Dallia pectoralis TaxID=75939 RepID=A0ACC2H628_DALPE|nr:hypothetical protein DPEC_G00056200 [Dallia pectoralis]
MLLAVLHEDILPQGCKDALRFPLKHEKTTTVTLLCPLAQSNIAFDKVPSSSNYSKLCHKQSHLAIQDISREEAQEDQADAWKLIRQYCRTPQHPLLDHSRCHDEALWMAYIHQGTCRDEPAPFLFTRSRAAITSSTLSILPLDCRR